MKKNPYLGAIVHFVLPLGHNRAGEEVPAIITRTWGGSAGSVQLTPFIDLMNDYPVPPSACSSVRHCEDAEGCLRMPGTWNWPDA